MAFMYNQSIGKKEPERDLRDVQRINQSQTPFGLTTVSATATLTAAQLQGKILHANGGGANTFTMPNASLIIPNILSQVGQTWGPIMISGNAILTLANSADGTTTFNASAPGLVYYGNVANGTGPKGMTLYCVSANSAAAGAVVAYLH